MERSSPYFSKILSVSTGEGIFVIQGLLGESKFDKIKNTFINTDDSGPTSAL